MTGVRHMDRMGLDDAEALGDVVERHPTSSRVIRVTCTAASPPAGGGPSSPRAPSTAHQVALDLTDGEARWRREPPAVQLHVWLPDEELLVTHSSPIGDFGPAEPF